MTQGRKTGRTAPLVADKRYSAASGRGAGATRKPRRKSSSRRGPGLLRALLRAPFRLLGLGRSGRRTGAGGTGTGGTGGRGSGGRGRGGRGHRPRGLLGWILLPFRIVAGLIWAVSWRLGLVGVLFLGGAVAYQMRELPDYQHLLDGRNRGSVTLLDRAGKVFAWRGDQFGGVVTAETVSPYLRNAIVATEDKRFYRHFGVSPRGIASAVRINLSEGRGPLSGHGGSTITQQTAKLLCLGVEYDPALWKSEAAYEADCRQSSVWRKAKEAIYAMAMEAKFSKDQILSIYMNRAYMGGGAYGAEAAAQRFFGKSANRLDAAEAAVLAGLLTAPSTLAPTANLQRSRDRAATVLRLMAEQGYLTTAQRDQAMSNPAELSEAASARAGGYFADWIMDTIPSFLGTKTTEDVIIRTTLDQRLQKAAEDAVTHIFSTKVREGSKAQTAVIVMSADGAVRAMVGGREVRASGVFNRATQAKRQTGSSFKPFVYAAALELGYSPYDRVLDAEYCLDIPGSGPWCPQNYTKRFYGEVSMADALRDSLNIPAVKISEAVGRDTVRHVAGEFGIDSSLADGPALALGASESTLIEMTGAYAGILNGGSAVTPYGVEQLSLVGDSTPLMDASGGMRERVIRREAAQQLIWMMKRVIDGGTGTRAQIPGWEAAGKSGTTSAAKDAWFIGFTAEYVTGVWMGYDDNTPLTGVTGGGLPAEIWQETMVRVHEGLTPSPLPLREPDPIVVPEPSQPARNSGNGGGNGGGGGVLNQILRDIFGN